MKYYELTYLINPDFSDEEARAFQAKVNSFIAEEGMLEEGNMILKKKLAYAILKKDQAYMAVATFNALPEKIASLEKKLKEEKGVLRYLLIIKEKQQTLRVRPHMARAKAELKETDSNKKVDMKEIDKKLDEIINEPQ
jgi:ribosomal protein S6